jgi:hypothetical protein
MWLQLEAWRVDLIVQSGLDLQRTIVITHERTTRLGPRLPGLLLYLYGHTHTFDVRESKGSIYANVSALDRILPVVPAARTISRNRNSLSLEERKWNPFIGAMRHVNAGNYAIIDINDIGSPRIECRLLHHAYKKWKVVTGPWWFGAPLVPEEAIFGDNIRFPKKRTA